MRVVTAVAAAIFLIRVLGEPWSSKFRPSFPDSFSYMKVARTGPFSVKKFWFGERPVLYPLLLWLTGRATRLTVLVQALTYVAAWMLMVHVSLKRLGTGIGAVMAIGLGCLAFQGRFAFWTTLLLSESLSMALAIAVIALWWNVVATRAENSLAPATVATIAWVLVRDSNAAIVLVTLGAGLVALYFWRLASDVRRRVLVAFLACFLACMFAFVGFSVSKRTRFGFPNAIGTRILPDAALTKWFVAGGMPVDDALRARTNKDAFADGEYFMNAPELAKVRKWIDGPGERRFYVSFAVRWRDWTRLMGRELPGMLGNDPGYDNFHVSTRLPQGFSFMAHRTATSLWYSTLFTLGISAAALVRGRRRDLTVFALIMFGSAYLDLYLSYLGDGVEPFRHGIGAVVRLEIAFLLVAAVAISTFFMAKPNAGAPETEALTDGHPNENLEAPEAPALFTATLHAASALHAPAAS